MKAKTKLTKLLSILLALVMVVGILPTTALAEEPATATADFSTDPTAALSLLNDAKTGTTDSTWDSTTKTLTLNGVNFTTEAATAVKLPDGAIIELTGDNTITGGNASSGACYGIYAEGNLTIEGSGTLTVTAGTAGGTGSNDRSCGIYTENALTMSSGIVKAYAGTSAKASLGIYSKGNFTTSGTADVTGNGNTATGDGSFGINAEGAVIISGGKVKATGGTGRGSDGIYSGSRTVTVNGGTVMAIGGAVTAGWSVGIFAYDAESGSGTVTINGGTVTSAANSRASETMPFYSRVTGADIKTIKFNSNNGSGNMAAKISGETYILPENVFTPPADKQFKCWNVGSENKEVGDEITVSENITVTAVWKSKEYNVTVNGGTASPSQAAAGTTVTLTADTATSGQVFDKWIVESGSITIADENSATTTFIMPAGDVSVRATYHTHSYGSEWKSDADKHWHECFCGDKSAEVAHTSGDWIIDTPATTTTDGKKHKACTACGYVMENGTIPATGYTVSFDANGGTGTMADVIGILGDYTLPANGFTAPEGKQFKAWSIGGAEKAVGDKITVTANTTVTAVWENIPAVHTCDIKPVAKVNPSCTTDGNKAYYVCSGCGKWFADATGNVEITDKTGVIIPATGHLSATTTTKATTSADGKIVEACTVCKETISTTIIPKASNVKLSATSYTYNGKVKTPSVTVEDSNGKALYKGTDYDVTYSSGRKNVGKYAVNITFKGNYSGTMTLYFTIKPKATSISKVTAGSKKFTVKWKKQSTQTTGYQIQYSTSSKFSKAKTVTVSKNKTTSKTVSKLKAKKKYYVRVRTYKTVKIDGKVAKIYSSWSKAKYVTTKK